MNILTRKKTRFAVHCLLNDKLR